MKPKALLVENDPSTVEVVRLELAFLGYEVVVATDGLEAVKKAAEERPDIVVMDILLPKMNGFQALKMIRDNPQTRSIPLLAATAMALPGDKQRCLAAGFDGYIAKPFTHNQLGRMLKKLIERRPDQAGLAERLQGPHRRKS
ncbi:MAG TPA: response regulator [Candidatus Acidoferrales bacterium]|nr:response regulator [Candidatus Acidoferrales bacterium]